LDDYDDVVEYEDDLPYDLDVISNTLIVKISRYNYYSRKE
jgi:hypothetical protein